MTRGATRRACAARRRSRRLRRCAGARAPGTGRAGGGAAAGGADRPTMGHLYVLLAWRGVAWLGLDGTGQPLGGARNRAIGPPLLPRPEASSSGRGGGPAELVASAMPCGCRAKLGASPRPPGAGDAAAAGVAELAGRQVGSAGRGRAAGRQGSAGYGGCSGRVGQRFGWRRAAPRGAQRSARGAQRARCRVPGDTGALSVRGARSPGIRAPGWAAPPLSAAAVALRAGWLG